MSKIYSSNMERVHDNWMSTLKQVADDRLRTFFSKAWVDGLLSVIPRIANPDEFLISILSDSVKDIGAHASIHNEEGYHRQRLLAKGERLQDVARARLRLFLNDADTEKMLNSRKHTPEHVLWLISESLEDILLEAAGWGEYEAKLEGKE